MIEQFVQDVLSEHFDAGSTIIDPFSGSGTVAAEAQQRGIGSINIDAQPFNRLLVDFQTVSPEKAAKYAKAFLSVVERILDSIQAIQRGRMKFTVASLELVGCLKIARGVRPAILRAWCIILMSRAMRRYQKTNQSIVANLQDTCDSMWRHLQTRITSTNSGTAINECINPFNAQQMRALFSNHRVRRASIDGLVSVLPYTVKQLELNRIDAALCRLFDIPVLSWTDIIAIEAAHTAAIEAMLNSVKKHLRPGAPLFFITEKGIMKNENNIL